MTNRQINSISLEKNVSENEKTNNSLEKIVKKRLVHIDIIKGILFLNVLYQHNDGLPITPKYIQFFNCSMPCFFFLSGYCSGEIKTSFRHHIYKRIKSLVKPLYICSIISLIVALYQENSFKKFKILFIGLFYQRHQFWKKGQQKWHFYTRYNYTCWFLAAMFISNIWFFIYKKTSNSYIKKIKWILFSIILSIIMGRIKILLPWSIDSSFFSLIFMIFGNEYKRLENKINNKINILLRIIGVIICLIIYRMIYNKIDCKVQLYDGYYGPLKYPVNLLFCFPRGIFGCLTFFYLGILLSKLPKNFICFYFDWIGKNSLYIVLTNTASIYISEKLLQKISNKYQYNQQRINFIRKYYLFLLEILICSIYIFSRNILVEKINKTIKKRKFNKIKINKYIKLRKKIV